MIEASLWQLLHPVCRANVAMLVVGTEPQFTGPEDMSLVLDDRFTAFTYN